MFTHTNVHSSYPDHIEQLSLGPLVVCESHALYILDIEQYKPAELKLVTILKAMADNRTLIIVKAIRMLGGINLS